MHSELEIFCPVIPFNNTPKFADELIFAQWQEAVQEELEPHQNTNDRSIARYRPRKKVNIQN